MSWIIAIALAATCFAAFVFLFRLPRKAWAAVLAMLALGLAGYALQASPNAKGAPGAQLRQQAEEGWRIVDLRSQMIDDASKSGSSFIVTADALVRKGQYANAANLLRGVLRENPNDGEAWLAMANALAFQADGALTPAALLAYRRAAETLPRSAGPPFFVGLSLIRQGRVMEGRELWAQQLGALPQDAAGREILAQRLATLDALLQKIENSRDDAAP